VSAISTHVLDVAAGCPAAGMRVRLERSTSAAEVIAAASTDNDGRVAGLGPEALPAGTYRLIFDTGGYLTRRQESGEAGRDGAAGTRAPPFFPEVTVTFTVTGEPGRHYHVPLLLSPFGYSTYRGS
jgi:5-hydroxyisourate hydrolase